LEIFLREHPLRGDIKLPSGQSVNADTQQEAVSDEYYFIVTDKCTECKGFHDEPQCAAVCPVDCCVPDEDNVESEEFLLTKQSFMHGDNDKQSSNETSSWFSVKS